MRGLIRKVLGLLGLEAVARLFFLESAAKQDGWFVSVKEKQAVDKAGKPIPWVTYPFIDFIADRLDSDITMFEFGSGNSTLYFADRVKNVLSIEHHPDWYEQVRTSPDFAKGNIEVRLVEIPANLAARGYHEMAFTDDVNDYVLSLKETGSEFDIVVVDGLFRNSCLFNCLDALSDRGVVFLDNTSEHYISQLQSGIDFMSDNGFKRLDFHGMGPIYSRKSCTSIFYRPDNCLGI